MSDSINNSQDNNASGTPDTRNLLLFLGGMMVLGVLLAFVLFGGELFSNPDENTAVSNPEDIVFEIDEMPPESRIGHVEIGQQAPDFAVENVNGETVALSNYEGQPVILNFWATWCAPCRIEMPEFEATYQTHKDNGLEILALNREESQTTISAFWGEMASQGTPLTFVPLLDLEGSVADQYGVFNMPTTYFVAPDGTITAVHRGPLNQELLEEYLAQIMPEEMPTGG